MTILLTGGTGKTSTRLASLLQEANIPYLLASRNPSPSTARSIKFDWLDPTTFNAPFAVTDQEKITAVYLILPHIEDPSECLCAFIDIAIQHGVKKFVMLTGSATRPGSSGAGKVWKYLIDAKVIYCVLQATWFMENLSSWQHLASIKKEGKIYSACGDGRTPFVSAGDIAAVAFRVLTDEKTHDTDYRVLGPELLTHDQLAAKLSSGLGRKIENVKLSADESLEAWKALGLPEGRAKFMAYLEVKTANGDEDRMNDAVEKVTGKPGQRFEDWVQENKLVWQ